MSLRVIPSNLASLAVIAFSCYPASGGVAIDEKLPSIAPEAQGVYPHGGMRGSSVKVKITGKNLKNVASIRFSKPGLRAEIISRRHSELVVNIEIDPNVESGRHDFRLIRSMGSNLAWFDVGYFPEIAEAEPNDSPTQAQPVTMPALVNGVIKKGDYDFYRFIAKAGETITFDLNGTRNGSPLDGVLALFDEAGEQLAYNDDYYVYKDPHLSYEFARAGSYLIRVSGSEEGGSDISDYRLSMGAIPYVSHVVPSGAQRGQTVTVKLHGVNLAAIDKVTLGQELVAGKVLKTSFGQAVLQLAIPETLVPGVYNLRVEGAICRTPFVIGDLPELTVSSPPTRSSPTNVKLPVVINGVLGNKGEAHYFRFHIDRPGKYVLAADSMRFGYPLDPLVSLHDAQGRRIAYQDEPNTNNGLQPANLDPHLVVDIPIAGDYIARIRDFAYRGAAQFVYRFTIKQAEPDFEVRVHAPDETLYRGRENRLKVRVRRLQGWDSPVEIRVENLPRGVSAEAVTAAPKSTTYLGGCAETHTINGTDVEVPMRVTADAPAAQQDLRFVARGVQDGKVVEREAWTRYRWRGRDWEDAETGRLLATIADPPLLVLDSPGEVTLSSDKHEASFEVLVKRFDGGEEPLVLTTRGKAAEVWEITADPIAPATTKARVKLRSRTPVSTSLVLVGTAGGRILGESPEIGVQVEDPAGKDAGNDGQ